MEKKKKQPESLKYKTWIISTVLILMLIFILFASIAIYIDPMFHYHKPLAQYSYLINLERYQNDGITKNFDYESIITGTSMTENFKTSEADKIFGSDFIKVPFSGGGYKEINDNLKRAYSSGKNIKYVIRCLDYSLLVQDKDYFREDAVYPIYLYNDDLLDDVNYIWNKYTLFGVGNVIKYTISGVETTSFDDYANWNSAFTFGAETVLDTYTLQEPAISEKNFSKEEREMVLGNIKQNVTDLADEHPETTFYYFFPPYSICYWDVLKNDGLVNWRIAAEEVAVEEILKHPNIKLYSFCNNFELVCNLDNYKDQAHYGEWVNSQMLEWMHGDNYLLSKDNYQEYIRTIRKFYNSYDYSSLHK